MAFCIYPSPPMGEGRDEAERLAVELLGAVVPPLPALDGGHGAEEKLSEILESK